MKRVIFLLPGAVLITFLVMITSPLPLPVVAESDDHTCTCPISSSCSVCDTGRCCSTYGYCTSQWGLCLDCYCGAQICDICNCDGTCTSSADEKQLPAYRTFYENVTHATTVVDYHRHGGDDNIIVATCDGRNLNSTSTNNVSAAASTPSWHVRGNISSSASSPSRVGVHGYGSAAVCGWEEVINVSYITLLHAPSNESQLTGLKFAQAHHTLCLNELLILGVVEIRTHDRLANQALIPCHKPPGPNNSSCWEEVINGSYITLLQPSTTVSANLIVPGQCLEVTNVENAKQAMVRVTDRKPYHCSNTSLMLDYGVFQQLVETSSHKGPQGDHFPISYKYVRCIDN